MTVHSLATRIGAPTPVAVHNLAKSWPGAQRPVFSELDIDCPAGGITIIVGPSGCGKTTFLRCLCGLDVPTKGEIRFGDQDVTRIDAQHRGVAMVFQNYALYPTKTAFDNIAFPLRMARVGAAETADRVRAAAALTRIEGLLERLPSQLSGGQRQRVGIARAIVRGPSVLLMDEPLSNLDTKLRVEMRAELSALQRELGATTVYVTHDQTEALALADHLIVMRDGKIEQQGAPEEIFRHPADVFVADFLGSMNLLAVRREGEGMVLADGTRVSSLPGAPSSGSFQLGFRAEDAHIGGLAGDRATLPAMVRRSELMGSERLVHLHCGGVALRARLKQAVAPGEHIDLHVHASALHYFSDDGQRAGAVA
ncbi:sn-glycerol-3-phosphate import ATP-binding protein UgpC [Chelatococcus asaccharovorans]|nr:sn-glycerol-3-phosphate import ATP-binding protein UgpC [Chelatococcus asaccharovorans]CAH1681013.1 sn-glycerol-3-phosphate import ATP-binding protein UgpC [Chelatococcus asaccharovorans]